MPSLYAVELNEPVPFTGPLVVARAPDDFYHSNDERACYAVEIADDKVWGIASDYFGKAGRRDPKIAGTFNQGDFRMGWAWNGPAGTNVFRIGFGDNTGKAARGSLSAWQNYIRHVVLFPFWGMSKVK